MGRKSDAAERYQRAAHLKPDYAAAHINLGSLMVAEGRFDAARRDTNWRSRQTRPVPMRTPTWRSCCWRSSPMRHCMELDRALQLDPNRLRRLTPFVWLLVAQRDPAARRVQQGQALAERIATATNRRDPSVLDALAAAQAANGLFDDAIASATEAIRLTPGGESSPEAQEIRARLNLYRAHRTFALP